MNSLLATIISVAILSASTISHAKKTSPLKESVHTGQVQSCYDGDTCRVQIKQKIQKIRFSGIDAPELKQEFGKESRDFLKKMILHKTVTLRCQGSSWDRKTCLIFLGEMNINAEMVRQGYAWDSPQYSKKAFQTFMKEAQTQKKGLWGAKNLPQSPYCYRKPQSRVCKKDRMAMSAQDL